jgi:hypothetical protein
MNSRERYTRAVKFAGPDRVPIMHRTIPGAFRRHGKALEALYARHPSDVLLSPSTRGWFAFRRGVAESSGALRGVTDEWGCVWDSLNPDYLGQVFGHPLDTWEKLPGFKSPEPTVGIEGVHEMVEAVKADGHRHYSLIEVGTLWHLTNWLRGFENSLMDVLEDRPELYELRDRITDFLLKRVELLLERREHIDGVLVNDDWGRRKPDDKPAYWRNSSGLRCHRGGHQGGVVSRTCIRTGSRMRSWRSSSRSDRRGTRRCPAWTSRGRRWGGVPPTWTGSGRCLGTPADARYVERPSAAFGRHHRYGLAINTTCRWRMWRRCRWRPPAPVPT